MTTGDSTKSEGAKMPGSVITFYSFKGGVGRSMALANLAVLLARQGKKVLCLDWDLEAPGLDRYFCANLSANPDSPLKLTGPINRGGLLSIFDGSSVDHIVDWKDFILTRIGADGSKVDIIGSGEGADDYSAKLGAFSWTDYFADRDGSEIIEKLRNEWKDAYDFILVDSRTGLTDSSGICTIQMPDFLVMLFAANEQNTVWSRRVAKSIHQGRKELKHDRAFLNIIPILSRFDPNEEKGLASQAMDSVSKKFKSFFSDWLPRSIKVRDMIEWSFLPYVPLYSYTESLAVEVEPESGPQGLTFRYQLLSRLILTRLQKVREVLAVAGVPGAALPPLLPGLNELRRELRYDSNSTIQQYREAIIQRVEDDPLDAAQALEQLADLCAESSLYWDAEQLFKETIDLLRNPALAQQDEIPRLIERRANAVAESGESEHADELYLKALSKATDLFTNADIRSALIRVAYARFLEEKGRIGDAVKELEIVAESFDGVEDNQVPGLRSGLENWRDLLSDLGQFQNAVRVAKRVWLLTKTASPYKSDDEAITLDRYATALQRNGNLIEAVDHFRKALELSEQTPHRLATALKNLAGALRKTGEYVEAEKLLRRALKIQEDSPKPNNPYVATICRYLAGVLRNMGQYVEAEVLLRRVLKIREESFSKTDPSVATACGSLAGVLRDMEKYKESEELLRRALAIDEEKLGRDHPAVAMDCGNLAGVLMDAGRYEDAEPLFRRALVIKEDRFSPDHQAIGITLAELAQCLSESGKGTESEPLWTRGIKLLCEGLGIDHPVVGRVRLHQAEHLLRSKRPEEAMTEIEEAIRILRSAPGTAHPDIEKATEIRIKIQNAI